MLCSQNAVNLLLNDLICDITVVSLAFLDVFGESEKLLEQVWVFLD